MKKYLIIFTSGVVTGALIGNIHPITAYFVGIMFGLGLGYIASILHMVCSMVILEKDIDND